MLRRGNSKSSNRLSRRKSTSSVQSKVDYIDPEVARYHAHAAATYAFARARERDSADIGRSEGLNRQKTMGRHLDNRRTVSHHDIDDDQGGRFVKRQQSVRFAGPEAVQRHQSIGTRAQQPFGMKASSASLRPRALTNNVPVPAAYRPPSRSSSIGKASIGKGTAASFMTALAAYDEYYTREDDVASTPSSYRRIRKSKSFLSPVRIPSILFHNGTPDNDYKTIIRNQFPGNERQPTLRGPRSMSFLRGGRDHMRSFARQQDQDMAVQIARDKFLHQVEQQRLREQPSFIFRSRSKREEKPFRQSVRTSSTNSYGAGVTNLPVQAPKDGSLRVKARKASQTIKNRLKGLFKRASNDEETTIPNQQVEAYQTHGSSNIDTVETKHEEFLDIPHPDHALVSRVSSRVPSLHAVPSSQQLRSRTGSLQSLRSDASGKSRVTSWTSTGPDNTANSRYTQAERERQRLSIIQENGTHVSAASFGRRHLANQFSAYPVLQQTSRGPHGHPPPVTVQYGAVDSQRVYSALMKRLEENSPKAKLAQRMASTETLVVLHPFIPARSSSVGSQRSTRGTPATIRQVCEDDLEAAVAVDGHQHQGHEDSAAMKEARVKETNNGHHHYGSRSSSASAARRKPSYSAYPPPVMGNMPGLTPQELATRVEPVIPPRIIRETRSGFFGNSAFTTLHRGTSPYRRALAEVDYNPAVITGDIPVGQSPKTTILRVPPVTATGDNEAGLEPVEVAYSESVYSRSASGQVQGAASSGSLPLLDEDFPFGPHGSMVVVDRAIYRPTPPQHRVASSAGSTEWKAWMSTQVSNLEKSKENDGVRVINYAMPSMPKSFGHVRESAQINEDDTHVATRKTNMQKQPLGIVQQNIQPKPILKNKSSLATIEHASKSQIPPPPPMPARSPIRSMQSRSSLRSVGTVNSYKTTSVPSPTAKFNSHTLLHARSNNTLRSLDTPAKLVKKHGRRPSDLNIPSPGITAAVEKQFGSTGSRTTFSAAASENISPRDNMARMNDNYGVEGAGLMGPQLDAQAMGSKRMVDLFLSSRRRRMAGSDDSHAFV